MKKFFYMFLIMDPNPVNWNTYIGCRFYVSYLALHDDSSSLTRSHPDCSALPVEVLQCMAVQDNVMHEECEYYEQLV